MSGLRESLLDIYMPNLVVINEAIFIGDALEAMNQLLTYRKRFRYLLRGSISLITVAALGATMILLSLAHEAAAEICETDFDRLITTDKRVPAWKLGRAATDILCGPNELFAYMTDYAVLGSYSGAYSGGFYGSVSGALAGYVAGFFPGLYHMVKRMSTGCLDMVTFWRPDVRPIHRSTNVLRGLGSGPSDYFDKEPYWYFGPPR